MELPNKRRFDDRKHKKNFNLQDALSSLFHHSTLPTYFAYFSLTFQITSDKIKIILSIGSKN
jgi:hypothetical protein